MTIFESYKCLWMALRKCGHGVLAAVALTFIGGFGCKVLLYPKSIRLEQPHLSDATIQILFGKS